MAADLKAVPLAVSVSKSCTLRPDVPPVMWYSIYVILAEALVGAIVGAIVGALVGVLVGALVGKEQTDEHRMTVSDVLVLAVVSERREVLLTVSK
jgi:hypothetical protein